MEFGLMIGYLLLSCVHSGVLLGGFGMWAVRWFLAVHVCRCRMNCAVVVPSTV